MSGMFADDNPDPRTGSSGTLGPLPPGAATPSAAPSPVSPLESRADALANAEQERSERGRVDAIQRQLRLETTSRSRGYGLRSLFGALGAGRSSLLGSG